MLSFSTNRQSLYTFSKGSFGTGQYNAGLLSELWIKEQALGHQLIWDDDAHTILRHQYEGIVPQEEFYEVAEQSALMLESVGYPVDLIVDVSRVTMPTRTFLPSLRNVNNRVPANQRLAVVIGLPLFMKAMVGVARKVAPRVVENVYFVDTLKQAHDVIAAYRARLPGATL